MRYIRIVSLLILIASSYSIQAQDWQLVMDLIVSDEGKKMPGAQVSLLQNGNTVGTFTSNSKGQVDVPVPPDGVYVLKVTSPGYVHKMLEIDTRNVNPEDIGEGDIFYRADVDIFKKIEGLNLDILDEPIGQIFYDERFGEFTYNKEYTLDKQAALAELKENYLKKKEEEEERLEEMQEKYEEAIEKADKAFESENWEEAKMYYEQAQELDPTDTYPSFQLGEIASKIIKQDADQEKYDAAIKLADAALASKNYKEALAQYKKAQGYKPEDQYALEKIEEVQEIAVQAAKVEQNYLAAIEEGDKALVVNDLETAKTAFLEAKELKPEESYPTEKLAEINSILSEKQQKEEEYTNAIAAAESSLSAKDYASAKNSFQKASELKPTESYPKEKIAEIDGILAEQAKKEQEYLAAVTEGDNALAAKKYEEAIAAFQTAASIKPGEEYPKSKITEINSYLAANAEKEKQYEEAIKAADAALEARQLEAAKTSYNKALELKPSDTYPQQKITEIDNLIAEEKAREEEYTAAIASADKAYNEKDFETAKGFYENALAIKPDESYPKGKIDEITNLVAQQAEKEENYNAAIASADQAFQEGNLESAQDFYEQALSIKPEETYPSGKILEIKEKLAAAEQVEKEYNAAITSADEFFASKDYQSAKEAYSNALSLKPNETYPAEKISEIEKALENIAAEEEAKRLEQERLAKLEADYQSAIAEADQLFAEKSWDEAAVAYNRALELKANEEYPGQKLEEIKKLKQEQLAQLKQEEVESAYAEAITKADQAFAEKNYELAKSSYKNALEIKAGETYPTEKLQEIATIEKQLAEEKQAKAAEELNQKYEVVLADADAKFADGQFEEAKNLYSEALSIKPNEKYPNDQLKLIEAEVASLQEQKAAEQLAKEKAAKLETDYLSAIALADQALQNKDYQSAKANYSEALNLKPEEEYPKQKIEEINALLAQKEESEAEKAALAEAQKKKDEEYNSLITKAEANLEKDELLLALRDFKSALAIKPNENYPKSKIEEIDNLIAQKVAAEEEEQMQKELQAQKEMDYLAAITEADDLYEDEKWEAAIAKYTAAQNIKPSESYPQQQIDLINTRIEQEKQLAEASEEIVEEEEEVIEVSKGPVSEISGETEENIDKMYEEIWEENKSGKESYFAQQKSQVEENKEEMLKREEERKKDAIERLEDISISYEESVKQSTRLNSQNYETVKNNKEIYRNNKEELRVKGQRNRERNWGIQQDLEDNIQEYQKETAEKNKNLYTDELKERTEDHQDNLQNYRNKQQEAREQRNEEYVSNAQELNEYKKHLKEKFERENKNRLEDVKEYHQEYSTDYKANQQQAIASVNDQLEAQAEFINNERKEQQASIELQAETLSKRKEEVAEMEAQRISKSTRRIQENAQEDYYRGEAKSRNDSLASRYPEGISEEVLESRNGSTTIKRIVVDGTQADVYTKTLHSWGGVFYTKNGRNITEATWNLETE